MHRMQKAVAFSMASGFPPSEAFALFCGSLLHSVIGNVGRTLRAKGEDGMEKTEMIDPRDGLVIEYVSTGWMIVEAVGSLFAGILASSTALEAFGIDSLIEIVAGATLI